MKNRFMAMSKLIGIFVGIAVLAVIVYSMIEMHRTQSLEALPQLIISIFALAGIYVGFYINMAKVEHVEYEITKRQKELKELAEETGDEELLKESCKTGVDSLRESLIQLLTKDVNQ